MTNMLENAQVSRRTFMKGSALAGLGAAAMGTGAVSLFGCSPSADGAKGNDAATQAVEETTTWGHCAINCPGRCSLKFHVQDDEVAWVETYTSKDAGFDEVQPRACLRGRTYRRWLANPDRINYPMKRVGKRGEGKFEPISWDEAIQIIADQLKYTIDTYGNEAIYRTYGSGMYSVTGNPSDRLLNILGGRLNPLYDYSTHMLQCVMTYMYGSSDNLDDDGNHKTLGVPATAFSPYDATNASSMTEAERASDLVVMFGNSPAETRMGGANIVWDFARVREAVQKRGGRIINIDYRLNETSSGHSDEWLPIRPGTDAALVNAIAHEWIVGDEIDLDFLHTYCVGYDEETLPESAKGQNKSYRDYIMGTGYDMVEKTPEWAAPITGISAETIRSLAREIADAEAPFIVQGWGPQRHTNGEDTTRAICMLPILIGKFGLPGTNTGQREAEPYVSLVSGLPAAADKSHVKASIPVYQWLNAVDHGEEMTATNAGIKGVDKLPCGIKFLWEYAGNCITNQHGDINLTHDILQDESKCEFILVWDTVMTDSAKYADILLPDAMRGEQLNMYTQGYTEWYTGVTVGGPARAPRASAAPATTCAPTSPRSSASARSSLRAAPRRSGSAISTSRAPRRTATCPRSRRSRRAARSSASCRARSVWRTSATIRPAIRWPRRPARSRSTPRRWPSWPRPTIWPRTSTSTPSRCSSRASRATAR